VCEDGWDAAGRPRVVVTGYLDAEAGAALTDACRRVLRQEPRGLALDLTGIAGATADGVRAVAACLEAGRELSAGVDIAVASSAGRRVLLATLAEV
jgi:hypothetical protein